MKRRPWRSDAWEMKTRPMKKIDFYEVAVKLLGLYLIVVWINQCKALAMIVLVFMNEGIVGPQGAVLATTGIGLVLLTLFVWLLLFRTRTIARLISKPADHEEDIRLFAEKRTIYALALVLLGLLTLVWTLPDFVVRLKNYFVFVQANRFLQPADKTFLLTAGIKIALGVFALVYADALAGFFTRKKNRGEA